MKLMVVLCGEKVEHGRFGWILKSLEVWNLVCLVTHIIEKLVN